MNPTRPVLQPVLRRVTQAVIGVLGSAPFNPRSLFLDGSKGVVYDNNDLSSFYLDSFGKTPATVNGLVGLQLDKSSALALGSEKASIASTSSGWTPYGTNTVADEDGAVKITYVTGADGAFCNITGLVSGLFYKVAVTAKVNTGSVLFAVNGSGVPFATVNETSYTDYSFYVQATGTSHVIYMAGSMGAGEIIWVKNISIKELTGNHRYQTTTGSKPVLRGTPTGANLVTNGDFASDVSGWTAATGGSISWASGKMRVTNGGGGRGTGEQAFTTVIGKVYRVRFSATAGTAASAFFGVAQGSGAASFIAGVSNSLGTDFYFTAVGTTTYVYAQPNITTAGVYIDVDNIEIHDVSAGQVTAPYGLQYDGVDDFLQTAAVDFTATDKMFVCAGVRKLSDAFDQATIAELGTNSAAAAGFALQGSPSLTARYRAQLYGTSRAVRDTSPVFAAPDLAVIAILFDIAGATVAEEIIGRRNGSVVFGENTLSPAGSGNFPSAIMYFGRRGGTSFPYNGLDFGMVICGKTLTSNQISSTERWIGQRTGVAL